MVSRPPLRIEIQFDAACSCRSFLFDSKSNFVPEYCSQALTGLTSFYYLFGFCLSLGGDYGADNSCGMGAEEPVDRVVRAIRTST